MSDRGLPLTPVDLIKNYLMSLASDHKIETIKPSSPDKNESDTNIEIMFFVFNLNKFLD